MQRARRETFARLATGAAAPTAAAELRSLAERSRLTVGADLSELVTGAVPPRPSGRAFLRSVGVGNEDLAIATLPLETT